MQENQNIEYKKKWRDEYLKWICGFANANGGKIFIGKDDYGKVVGVTNAKKLLEDVPNKAKDILGVIVDVNLHSENEKDYLEIIVEDYPYPVNYKGQFVKGKGEITNKLYQELCDTSKATATRDLTELVEIYKLFERIGVVGAGTAYKLIGS